MNASLHHFGRAAVAAHAPLVAGVLSRLREAFARRRRRARLQAELGTLDDAMLRDIGLQRSEIGSFWAENEGLAPRTRRRVGGLDPAGW